MAYPNETPHDQSPLGGESSTRDQAKQAGQYAAGQAKDVASNAADQGKNVASNAGDRAKDVAQSAKSQAADVKETAVATGSEVVESAKQQAGQVIDEAKGQGQQLLNQGLSEVRTQVQNGQSKLAEIVRSLTDELDSMVKSSSQSGPVTQLARNVGSMGDRAASWLENRGPDDVVADVRRFAARSPLGFLAVAAGVGLVGSRIARGIQGATADEKERTEYRQRSLDTTYATRPDYDVESGYTQQGYATEQGYTTAQQGYTTEPGYVEPGRLGYGDQAQTGYPAEGTRSIDPTTSFGEERR